MRHYDFSLRQIAFAVATTLSLLMPGLAAHATGSVTGVVTVPAAFAVNGELPALPADVIDLKFHDFFTMPVGPRGLTPTAKLLSLHGKRVRLVGYMAQQEVPTRDMFELTPLPVSLGDEDESLSDDLPPSTVFVHLAASGKQVPYLPGLIKLTGVLSVGAQEEADGHVSAVRLQLDPTLTQTLLSAPTTQPKNH